MKEIKWHEANENQSRVKTVAIERRSDDKGSQIIGYNGILKGDTVTYLSGKYVVVMVSVIGDFGLSESGELPYILRVRPDEVYK